ncbi:MAG: Replication factor C small subunit [Euryarchaeota archaeon ADurb.Bin023]|nr:MAG: Replication factor C small subunit [Euryarchaeota archaeon ADurb.Bin023]
MNNDTNEYLIRSLKEEMEKEEFLSSYDGKDKVISSYDMNEELKKSGALEVKGYNCGFPYLSSKIGKLEPGNIITVTGYSGQGKTTILISMTIKLAEQGIPVLWFSYENTPAQFFRKFQNVDLPLFYLPMSNKPYDLSWFTDRVKEAILKYDIKVIMIDHLHYILDLFQSKNSSIDIGNLLRNLKILAVENELVIFLVAHTKQPKDFNDPDMGSIRDCLTGDDLIYTDKGEIRVDSIKTGSKILSFGGLNKLKEGMVKNVWETGEKDIYTVRTKTGKEIKCSDGHKFFATTSIGGSFGPNNKRGIRGWTKLKDLKVGEKIYVAGSLPYDSGDSSLTLSQASTVGWIIGDGHITERYHTEVTTSTMKEAQYLLHMAGISGTITPYKDKKAFRVHLSNKKEANWIRDLFKKNKFCPVGLDKNIPGFIKSLGKLEKAAFLRGLFHADGSINKSGINSLTVSLCNISYSMLKDVQHMLLELNIKSWLRKKRTHGTYPNSKGTYNLCIYGQDLIIFSHMIGFFCDKQHKLDNLIENFIPKSKKQRNLFFDKIVSIEKTGREMTYDIETTTGSFIVNDILTHNSSFIVQESDKVLAVHRSKGSGRSKVIVLKDRDFGSSMGQYSEFFLNGNLLEEVETYKQGEVCKAASESRKEGERLRDLEAVKEII